MKRKLTSRWVIRPLIVLVLVGSVAAVFVLSEAARHKAMSAWHSTLVWVGLHAGGEESDSWFWCPMHPEIKRKKANEVCPICNMALVPLEGEPTSTDALVLTVQQIQQAGVITLPVLRRKLYREVDTTGRIAEDERLSKHITSWIRGKSRVVKQYVNFVGDDVTKGKLLMELYSPDLISAQHEYLIAMKNGFHDKSLARLSREKLQFWGMTSKQVDELAARQKVWDHVPIEATISGTVTKRYVKEGEYVSEGDSLYHLADLSQLWLFADIYEDELSLIKLNQKAILAVRSMDGKTIAGVVAFRDPVVQPKTRTVRVRFNIDNSNGELKPGMYARVQLKSVLPEMLAVPENAVLWSGKRTVVLVKLAKGMFQPREVRLGRKWLYAVQQQPKSVSTKKLDFGEKHKRYHEVLAGLVPGDEVVTAGAFLLNAESQFQSILTKMLPPESESATLEEVVGKPLAKDMRSLLEAYYKIGKTLADDQIKPISENAKVLAEAATVLAEQAKQAKLFKLSQDADAITQFAKVMATADPKDIKKARYHFGRISKSTVKLLADNGGKTQFGKDVFLFRCGMSKVGYENWLWWSSEKLNPYMGQRMLT